MKLTSASMYALRAVVYMAAQENGKPVASHEIARARGISEKFLLKVLTPLVRAHVLLSLKGPNGGYRLARPANKISLLEVVEAVDGPIRGYAPLAAEGGDKLDRRLQSVCNEAADHLREQLEKVRISDLVAKGGKR